MKKKILVVGGTGMLALPVVLKLIEAGHDVTVLSSKKETNSDLFGGKCKIAYGDVTKQETLETPIEQNEIVHINLNAHLDKDLYEQIEINGTKAIVEVARKSSLERISIITSATITDQPSGPIYRTAKIEAEKALKESGVSYTIFRPSWFFESLPMFVQKGKAAIIGDQPLKIGWLAASDYAQQVTNALCNEDAKNKAFYCLGPEKLTMLEALQKYCTVKFPELTPEVISFSSAKMLAMLPSMKPLQLAIPFFEYFSTMTEDVDKTEADHILGENKTTIDEWLIAN